MRNSVSIGLSVLALPFLWQCVASQQDMQSLDLRLRTMDTRMVALNSNLDHLENRTANQAAMGSTMDRLETELLQLKARLDENAHFLKQLEEENKRRFQTMQQEQQTRYQMLAQDLEQRLLPVEQQSTKLKGEFSDHLSTLKTEIHQLGTQLAQTAAGLEEIRQARVKDAAEQAALAAKEAEKARQAAAKAGEPREIAPEQLKKKSGEAKEAAATAQASGRPSPEQALYDVAYALYKEEKHKEAYAAFSDFLEKHPSSQLAPNARFWLGDTLFNQKEFELAILEYQKVIANFPNNSKASAAMLKQGLAFERLQDQETAKIIYRKLLADYPNSEQFKTAQARLDELK